MISLPRGPDTSANFRFPRPAKSAGKTRLQFFDAASVGRAFLVMVRVQEENRQKMPSGLQERSHAADIVHAAAGRNRAKAGMLEDPVKFASHRLGTEKISQNEGNIASQRKTPRRRDRERSNIQPTTSAPLPRGPGVMAKAVAGHHQTPGDWIFLQPCDERGTSRAILPRRIASPVAFLQSTSNPAPAERDPVLKFSLVFANQKGEVSGQLQLEIRIEDSFQGLRGSYTLLLAAAQPFAHEG